ncbi:MAG TPA: hypothetical protein VG269_05660 [Tepidisphaeraceae bacterium]|nr:hypothetical protein [Tepidisphaeraceae bacterium]
MASYTAFGLAIRSNVPVPGLSMLDDLTSPPDVQIWLGTRPPDFPDFCGADEQVTYCSRERTDGGEPTLSFSVIGGGTHFRFRYVAGVELVIDRGATRIVGTWPGDSSLEDVAIYLLGPVLAFALRLRGIMSLHSSAIAVDGQAVAFLGPGGAGKSSTAAFFALAGFPLVSDDVLPLRPRGECFVAEPTAPRIRLWPESVSSLLGSADALPLLTPAWGKRYLDVLEHGHGFRREPIPLGAIYVLGERTPDADAPLVEPLPKQKALMTLVSHTYVNYLLTPEMRGSEFDVLSRLSDRVPMRLVTPREDFRSIRPMCGAILEDFRSLRARGMAGSRL